MQKTTPQPQGKTKNNFPIFDKTIPIPAVKSHEWPEVPTGTPEVVANLRDVNIPNENTKPSHPYECKGKRCCATQCEEKGNRVRQDSNLRPPD